MKASNTARVSFLQASLSVLAGLALMGVAQAEDAPVKHPKANVRAGRVEAAPPLTVRRRAPFFVGAEPIVATDGYYDGTGLFRSWNDPRLTDFYGWRLGGESFYGDQRGSPITHGNAGLGAIAGYGGARGGYGGPHFDSVGGFHNGPGPLAKEDADYATGSIWQPRYDRPVPAYPSLKQQVAELDTGLAGTGQVSRVKSSSERWAEAERARYEGGPVSPEPPDGF